MPGAARELRVGRALGPGRGRHEVHPEPLALAGHRLQRPHDRTRGRPAGTAERGRDQRVQIVDQDDQAGQRGALRRCGCGPTGRSRSVLLPGGSRSPRLSAAGACRWPTRRPATSRWVCHCGEAEPAEQLGPALQLGAERLRELPHPYGVGGDQVG